MATSRTHSIHIKTALDADRHDALGLVLSGALPLSVFVIVHGMAEFAGTVPLFFAPFGLPGWLGAALHIATLPLLGVARWMVVEHESREGRNAGWWLVGLMAGMIALPFVVGPLDSLLLCLASMSLLLVGMATSLRVAKVSPRAALLMLPGVLWMGVSAFVGLSLVAAWAPPFGLTNGNGQS
ncbi:MAG: tryptophan-rich sensory protein [Devosia sp.]